jgi:ParB family transcriptional regulator, chromosome partitioning protein
MSAKKNALGRGLGALIEEASDNNSNNSNVNQEPAVSINDVDIDLIEINPFQPRKSFDEEAIDELAASIKELGIIQPITVRKIEGDKFQIITGERRFRASQKAGLKRMPAYIRTADDQAMLELALVENIQRQDLNAIEISISYQRLIDECNLTQESMSERVGKKRSTVANYLRLLKLPAEIQLGISQLKIGMGHAKALINIDSPEEQIKIYNVIIEDDLSVRQVEELVRALKEPKDANESPVKTAPVAKSENTLGEFADYRDQLKQFFSSKVELNRNNKGVGKIVIPFNSDEELINIMSLLEKLKNQG